MKTNTDQSYENALRAAREVWEPDSPDFQRREVLDRAAAGDPHILELIRNELIARLHGRMLDPSEKLYLTGVPEGAD